MASYDVFDMFLEENSLLKMDLLPKDGPSAVVKQRKKFGEFSTLYSTLRENEEEFHEYTRMSISTFDYILEKIESRLRLPNTNFHVSDSITPTEKLIVTLRFLATGTSFRSLAFTFRMGKTTVADIVYVTCTAIWLELHSIHMPHPNQEDLKNIASDYFRLWQFPMCIGSIAGKHCRIKCPANSGSSGFNYKHFFSLILQGVADANKKFIAIEVGGRGNQNDGGAFHFSSFNYLIENEGIVIPPPDVVPGTTTRLPYVLIADEAYPLKTNIMRPFPSKNLDTKSEYFNKRLSRARKCIECTFGILYAKWRILGKAIETNEDHACTIIKAACILHNVIRNLEGDDSDENVFDTNVEMIEVGASRRNNSSSVAARLTRDQFSEYFWENRT